MENARGGQALLMFTSMPSAGVPRGGRAPFNVGALPFHYLTLSVLAFFCRMINFLAFASSADVMGVFTNSFQSHLNDTGSGAIKLSASKPQRPRGNPEGDRHLLMFKLFIQQDALQQRTIFVMYLAVQRKDFVDRQQDVK